MTQSSEHSPTFQRFLAPLEDFRASAEHQRLCHKVPDTEWVNLGIERVIGDHRSGCGFIQERLLRDLLGVTKSHYFESCKSRRRRAHLASLSDQFVRHHAQLALEANDLFGTEPAVEECLRGFHVYAGDGHFHAASSHDERDEKKTKNAVGHLYALNLRNQLLSHLALGSDGSCKKPHDMGVLKKLDLARLRQGAAKGQKVLYVWDRAGIDFAQWQKWKQRSGVYFLSRVKKNMKLEHPAAQDFDRCDPLNAGVLADELVSNSCGTLVRRVRFVVPETGETMEFLTNLGRLIPPGVVAQLYFMRWRIEKSFDEIKNKLHETKAWAMSANAKAMQAAFIVLAYNLAQLLHAKLEQEHDEHGGGGPHDPANQRQRLRRASQLSAIVVERKGQLPLLREVFQKPSQLGIKFYRWLRHHFLDPAPWSAAQARLRLLYNQS